MIVSDPLEAIMILRHLHDLADALFNCGAVKFGSFTLKAHEADPSLPLSPFYFNLRTSTNPKPGPLTSDVLKLMGTALAHTAHQARLAFDGVCGIPNAGEPIASALMRTGALDAGARIVTLQKKSDGTRRWIDRVKQSYGLRKGKRILIIDDVITGADTKLEAIRVLRDAGLTVTDLLVLVNRQQTGGVDTVHRQGVAVHSVFTVTDLLDYYREKNRIDQETFDRAMAYIQCGH